MSQNLSEHSTSSHTQTYLLQLSPGQVLKYQLVFVSLLLILSTAGQLIFLKTGDIPLIDGIIFLFYVDGELTIPALYSGITILICSLMLAFIAFLDKLEKRFWIFLSIVIGYIGIDELLGIHEETIEPLRSLLGINSGFLYYAWVAPALICLVIFGLIMFKFLLRLNRKTSLNFIFAGCIFIFGALGMEMLSANFVTASGDELRSRNSLAVIFLTTVEEALEMIGMALFFTSILVHIRREHPNGKINIRFSL